MIRRGMLVLSCVWVSAAGVQAVELGIRNGDVVVFLGDDATEEYGGAQRPDRLSYPTLVESFLTVRYPDIRVTYYNDAMSGATAANTLARLDRDVLPQKPTVAVICLGLRDAGSRAFDSALLAAHKAAMERLIRSLKNAGCRVYLLSPPALEEPAPGQTGQPDYNDTLARYAAAQREIASAESAQFVDWFGAVSAARSKGPRRHGPASPDVFRPSFRSCALAASLLLDALHAEPLDVEIEADWKSGAIRSSLGTATLTVAPGGARVIRVTNLPLPWPSLVGQGEVLSNDTDITRWCRFLLKVKDAPPTGVLMADGDRQVPVLPQQLAEGLNLVPVEPLRSLDAAQELSNLIRRKNYVRTHAWRDQELQPIRDPELVEAQKTLIAAWYKYFAGYDKIIARMPKTFDLRIELSELKLTLPTSMPETAPSEK
ncbi:MAG TPA: SGNH/GDSL hydrolase family protein [Phycisphaerae bacterium]|nr:SGNH/GDSL hydrolase family protein [Phycisphaerae bacterium]